MDLRKLHGNGALSMATCIRSRRILAFLGTFVLASCSSYDDAAAKAEKYGISKKKVEECEKVFPPFISYQNLNDALNIVAKEQQLFGLFGPTCESLEKEARNFDLPDEDYLRARKQKQSPQKIVDSLVEEIANKNGVTTDVVQDWIAESGSLRLLTLYYRQAKEKGKVFPRDTSRLEEQIRYQRSKSGYTEGQVSAKRADLLQKIEILTEAASSLLAEAKGDYAISGAIALASKIEALAKEVEAAYSELIEIELYTLKLEIP